MELPHLTMYLRRVLASPARLPLREALRTARVRALLGILGWVLLSCLYMLFYIFGPSGEALSIVGSGILLLAVWYLLFGIAEQMYALLPSSGKVHPDWQATPLSSPQAIVGLTLAALLGCLPVLCGLALFLLFDPAQIYNYSFLLPQFSLGQLGLLALRLPLFCLASACLMLLARNLRVSRLSPWLLATAGAAAVLWRFDPQPLDLINFHSVMQPLLPGPSIYFVVAMGLFTLLWLCYMGCSRESAPGLAAALLAILLISPAVLGLNAVAWAVEISIAERQASGAIFSPGSGTERLAEYHYGLGLAALPLYLTLGSVYPTITTGRWQSDESDYSQFKDSPGTQRSMSRATSAISVLATVLWLLTCIGCLDAVRGIRSSKAVQSAEQSSPGPV